MLNNQNFFLKTYQTTDHYGLMKDKNFISILKRMIAPNNFSRPNVSEVLNCKFVVKEKNRGMSTFKPPKNRGNRTAAIVNKFWPLPLKDDFAIYLKLASYNKRLIITIRQINLICW